MKTIPKQVLQGLKSVADETLEQGVDNVKEVVGLGNSTKNEQDLFPDIKDMTDAQKQQLEQSDEVKKQQEMARLRQEMEQGRQVEVEMEEVRRQKEEEKKKEEEFLENLKRQRMIEEEERRRMVEVDTPQHKKKKSRGSAFARGKKPSQDQMSATGEFSKKAD